MLPFLLKWYVIAAILIWVAEVLRTIIRTIDLADKVGGEVPLRLLKNTLLKDFLDAITWPLWWPLMLMTVALMPVRRLYKRLTKKE